MEPEPELPRPKKGRRNQQNLDKVVEAVCVGAFALTAYGTGHAHWLKDKEDVKPITDPLNAWVETLPVKMLKNIEKNLCPVLLAIGLGTVIGPDLILEMKLRAQGRRNPLGPEGPIGGLRSPFADAGRPDVRPGGGTITGNGARSEGRQSEIDRDPSYPPIIPGIDV